MGENQRLTTFCHCGWRLLGSISMPSAEPYCALQAANPWLWLSERCQPAGLAEAIARPSTGQQCSGLAEQALLNVWRINQRLVRNSAARSPPSSANLSFSWAVSQSGASLGACPVWWHSLIIGLCSTPPESGLESLNEPAIAFPHVLKPVVKAAGSALPEFNTLRHNAVTTPKTW